jgi:hypothetical protein
LVFSERRGPVREFLRSPFQRIREKKVARTYQPIVSRNGERTIAVNGIAVPEGVLGTESETEIWNGCFQKANAHRTVPI